MSLESDIKVLACLPIFSSLEAEALKLIAFAAEQRTLRAGDLLIRQRETSYGGFAVISGEFALDSSQNGTTSGKIVGPGALLGELALLVATKNSVTAIARQTSTVLKISRPLFLRTLEESPVSAQRLRFALDRQLGTFAGELEKVRRVFLD